MESSNFTSLYQQFLQRRKDAFVQYELQLTKDPEASPPSIDSETIQELYDGLLRGCLDMHEMRMKEYFGKSWKRNMGDATIVQNTIEAAIDEFFTRIDLGEFIKDAFSFIKDKAWFYFVKPLMNYPELFEEKTRKDLVDFLHKNQKVDKNQAEFIADETIEKVINRILGKERGNPIDNIAGYLKSAAKNKLNEYRDRKEKPYNSMPLNDDDSEGVNTNLFESDVLFQEGEIAPDEQVNLLHVTEIVSQLVAQLNETDQISLKLRYFDGLTPHEAAEILGIEVNAMNQRTNNARRHLNVLLKNNGFDVGDRYQLYASQ